MAGVSETGDGFGASVTAVNTAPRAVSTTATLKMAVGITGEAIGTVAKAGAINTFSLLGTPGANDGWLEAGDGDGVPGPAGANQNLRASHQQIPRLQVRVDPDRRAGPRGGPQSRVPCDDRPVGVEGARAHEHLLEWGGSPRDRSDTPAWQERRACVGDPAVDGQSGRWRAVTPVRTRSIPARNCSWSSWSRSWFATARVNG